MSAKFQMLINWKRTKDFSYDQFNRSHDLIFSGPQTLNNSAAPEYLGDANMANPEELLASALGSCHMLTFLAVASKSGYIVEEYSDSPIAILDKNENGRLSITEIELTPLIKFSGVKTPTEEQLHSLHDKAHRNCFIANSINTKVTINSAGNHI